MHKWHTTLRAASAGYAALYGIVLFVALATSGTALFDEPGAWYAAVAPLAYAATAALWSTGRLSPRWAIALVHLLALPALVFSFLGLGLFLPILCALWWMAAGKPRIFTVKR